MLTRPLVAVSLGGLLGWERESSNKPAGLRTMMMVGLGSAGFTAVVFWMYRTVDPGQGVDPTRVVQGVVGGIGFLGAGAIIQARGSVQGITTAATIWVVGAIGVACGVGQYVIAGGVTAYAFVILWAIGALEYRLYGQGHTAEQTNRPDAPPDRHGDDADQS